MTSSSSRWIRVVVAILAIATGALLLGKPYQSLEILPVVVVVAALVVWFAGARAPVATVVTIYLAALAVTAFISPFGSVALALYGALAWMVVVGVTRLLSFRQRHWGSVAFGLSLVLLALFGLYWLDLASIILGLLVGPTLIVAGLVLIRNMKPRESRSIGRARVILGHIGAAFLVVLTVTIAVLTVKVENATPRIDDFVAYAGPLGDEPGVLLASEPFSQGMPENSTAYRILYTTTAIDGGITLATGLVILPDPVPIEELPVILWAHGTTGVANHCAPSLLDDPLGSGAMLFPERALDQGWAIVAPDYLGLGTDRDDHPYMVGKPTAHSSLDAVRAARQLNSVHLSDETVVWGHSQGGGAALWIGIEQPGYAPDVPLLGVAAMSPATDLPAFAETALSSPAGPIFGGFMVQGYAAAYDDVTVEDVVRPGARFSQQRVSNRCLSEYSTIASLASALITEDWTQGELEETSFYGHLGENVPESSLGVPLFVGQGLTDTLILPMVQENFVSRLCDLGQVVEYHTYSGRDHMGVVADESPMLDDLVAWTIARFAHEPGPDTCVMSAPE